MFLVQKKGKKEANTVREEEKPKETNSLANININVIYNFLV